jgi:hypothetical protein
MKPLPVYAERVPHQTGLVLSPGTLKSGFDPGMSLF